jgi:hypothetical protein
MRSLGQCFVVDCTKQPSITPPMPNSALALARVAYDWLGRNTHSTTSISPHFHLCSYSITLSIISASKSIHDRSTICIYGCYPRSMSLSPRSDLLRAIAQGISGTVKKVFLSRQQGSSVRPRTRSDAEQKFVASVYCRTSRLSHLLTTSRPLSWKTRHGPCRRFVEAVSTRELNLVR